MPDATRHVPVLTAVPDHSLTERVRVDGKFLAVGDERLWVRGVTYGTFAESEHGHRFGTPQQVDRDFEAMALHGINAVRTYTAPPRAVLDTASRHGLRVMVGLSWEQHVAFLGDRSRASSIIDRVREQALSCAGHPALLAFAVGNEIPTPIVRWHGSRRVESFIERLCSTVREEDPQALLTYVNYPSTEYLRLPFVDFLSFNLYLGDCADVTRYLARLQNLAGEKPLLLAELGADSIRGGIEGQAETVSTQVDAAFGAGCAGTFVFAWTDEWHRGEDEVLDWDFGMTDRARRPKPALERLKTSYRQAVEQLREGPFVSIVVCSRNGAETLRSCLEGVARLRYPSYETIVVDDGSTDATAAIASEYDVRLTCTAHQGLAAARNIGLSAARGDIVAYLDDDASPDPDWLRFLVEAFGSTEHVAVGGPNLPPTDDGAIAGCVANAPGGPIHVLVSDSEAEHLPGCNMAFRREALLAVDGFDPQFSAAGDDVDICWQLQEKGATLGFHGAAVVWHRRRSSVRGYWRQQRGYGHAEALLERKWPERYNRRGHLTWTGRLYDRATSEAFRPRRIYHGTWGTGAFQPEERLEHGRLTTLMHAPEWYLVLAALAGLSLLGIVWTAFLWAVPLLVGGAAALLIEATRGGLRAELGRHGPTRSHRLGLRMMTAFLHLLQPAARLSGRLAHGLSPWRQHGTTGVAVPRRRSHAQWYESWSEPRERVARIERAARAAGARVVRAGPYARWDLEISGGAAGRAKLLTSVEEHGRGRQLVRSRVWPGITPAAWRTTLVLTTLTLAAILTAHSTAAMVLGGLLVTLVVLALFQCSAATAAALQAFGETAEPAPPPTDVVAVLLPPGARSSMPKRVVAGDSRQGRAS